MNKEDIKAYFPWEFYRDNQESTIGDIIKAYDEGVDVVILRAPVGFGKCLHKDTMLRLKNGEYISVENLYSQINKIKENNNNYVLSCNVDNNNTEFNKIIGISRRNINESKVLKITTKFGKNTLKVTDNHIVFVWDNGFKEKEAKDIKIGDYLISLNNSLIDSNKNLLNDHDVIILGYLLGDGGLSKINFSFTNSNNIMLEDYIKNIKLCGFNTFTKKYKGITTDIGVNSGLGKNYHQGKKYNIFTQKLADDNNKVLQFYKKFGIAYNLNSYTKYVPDIVFKTSKHQKALFLNRIFSCDGSINDTIEYSSNSLQLIKGIVQLLLDFGINSSVTEEFKYPVVNGVRGKSIKTYRLFVMGLKNFNIFKNEINFIHPQKNKKLNDAVIKHISFKSSTCTKELLPDVSYYINDIYKFIKEKYGYNYCHNNTRLRLIMDYKNKSKKGMLKYSLKNSLDFLKEINSGADKLDSYNKLYSLINSNLTFFKISKIEEIKNYKDYVYDIEVKNNHNLFVGDFTPFLVHNSPVGYTVGRVFNPTYYTTPQKMLQDQLAGDFKGRNFEIVKGRANFKCLNNKETCSYGACKLKKVKVKRAKDDPSSCCDIDKSLTCPYRLQRDIGLDSQICTTNFKYFMTVPPYLFTPRKLLIVDEGHSIPNWALDFVKVKINISTRIEGEEISIIDYIPTYDTFEEYLTWFKEKMLPLLDAKKHEILETSEGFSSSEMSVGDKKLYEYLDALMEKMGLLIDDYESTKEKWVWEIKGEKQYKSIEFQPVTVGRFMGGLLWSRAEKVLLMSGTILAPDMFLDEIGLKDKKYKVISVPTNFHYHNNPVLYYPIGKMSKEFKMDTLPKMVKKIEEIIEKHGEEKGIIHSNSYDIAEYIYYNLKKYRSRAILQKRDSRDKSLEEFKNSKNKIFISINMNEGLDLKDDLARYQILAKIPFPFIGDKRIYERLIVRGENDWYNLQAVEDICQAFGRAVRTDTDWATFYILDESFASLWNRYGAFFTQEFINSYLYGNQLKKALESNIDLLPKYR